MNNEIAVSVIVPAYNAEKYLEQGIKMLLNQTLNNIEIICVDDGSTDTTLNIMNKLKEENSEKIVVVSNEHRGVYVARESGIKVAKGKYIGFFDCDDKVSPIMYESLYNQINNSDADMAFCGFKRVERKTNKVLSTEMVSFGDSIIDVSSDKSKLMAINTAMWNKLIRSDIMKKCITLSKPPRMLEDMMMLLSIYPYVNKIITTKDVYYTYYISNSSVMSSIQDKEIQDIQNAMIEVKKYVLDNKNCENIKCLLSGMAFIHFGISILLWIAKGNFKETNKWQKKMKNWLDKNFEGWNRNKSLKLGNVLKDNRVLLKPMIVKWTYQLGVFTIFIKIYVILTQKMKFDIKW